MSVWMLARNAIRSERFWVCQLWGRSIYGRTLVVLESGRILRSLACYSLKRYMNICNYGKSQQRRWWWIIILGTDTIKYRNSDGDLQEVTTSCYVDPWTAIIMIEESALKYRRQVVRGVATTLKDCPSRHTVSWDKLLNRSPRRILLELDTEVFMGFGGRPTNRNIPLAARATRRKKKIMIYLQPYLAHPTSFTSHSSLPSNLRSYLANF